MWYMFFIIIKLFHGFISCKFSGCATCVTPVTGQLVLLHLSQNAALTGGCPLSFYHTVSAGMSFQDT